MEELFFLEQSDGETGGNMFGCAGSSARLNDSELLILMPPYAWSIKNEPIKVAA
jgi:hypothetical protein